MDLATFLTELKLRKAERFLIADFGFASVMGRLHVSWGSELTFVTDFQ
jgi:hypothetical protein